MHAKKLNVFEFFIFVTRFMSFAWSPINSERFKFELKARNKRTVETECEFQDETRETSFEDIREPDWSVLSRPRELVGLVKRYHMAGNFFIFFLILQILTSLHLAVKSIIYTFYVGENLQLTDYLTSNYYPPIAALLTAVNKSSKIFCVFAVSNLIARIRNACRLIRSSIRNAEIYRNICVTSINLADLTLMEFTIGEFKILWNLARNHTKEVKTNRRSRLAHLQFNKKVEIIGKQISQFDRFESRRKKYRTWHCAIPAPRCGPGVLVVESVLALYNTTFAFLGVSALMLIFFYLELITITPEDQEISIPRLWESLMTFNLLHLVRYSETIAFFIQMIPFYFDTTLALHDFLGLASRLERLKEVFNYEDEIYTASVHRHALLKLGLMYEDRNTNRKAGLPWSERLDSNKRLQDCVRLVSLLYLEFVHLRRYHTAYINLITISGGINLAFVIVSIGRAETSSEITVLILFLFACVNPVLNVLKFAATVERKFKALYKVMTRLVVNELSYYDLETVHLIRVGCEQFENTKDRSILIAGLYAITLESVGPFLGYIATAILFLNRYVLT